MRRGGRAVRNMAVVIMLAAAHAMSSGAVSVEAPPVIPGVHADGPGDADTLLLTVEELFRIRGVEPQAGCLYASPDKLRILG